MSKKKVLIVGAGPFQMPAILKAKEKGFETIVTDRDPNACGFKIADQAEIVDVKDVDRTLEIARKYKVNGVMSIVSEWGVRTVAEVANELGLSAISVPAARAATDKGIMRKLLEKAGLPVPPFREAANLEQAKQAIAQIGLPVVIKPVDNSGSRGVIKIDCREVISRSFDLAVNNSLSGKVIIEKFLDGIEMTVEALSYNGKHEVLAMSSKKRIDFPYCVSIDLTYPPYFDQSIQDQAKDIIAKGLTALGIDEGPSHSEVMVTKDSVDIVEIAARGGGFGVFSDIVPLVSGVDIVGQCLNIVMDEDVDIRPKYQKAAVLRFFAPPLGKILNISGVEIARKLTGVHKIEMAVKPGDILSPISCDGERPGLMITYADTREQAVYRADAVEEIVKFEVEKTK